MRITYILNIAKYHKDYDDFPIFTIRKIKLKPFILYLPLTMWISLTFILIDKKKYDHKAFTH